MKPTNIKPTNLDKILAFAYGDHEKCVQGSQLQALYRLIQQKGETITGDNDLNGLKCLKLPNRQYLVIIHYPIKNGSFYPCKTRTYLLTEETTEQ